jgi:hypothetical protein
VQASTNSSGDHQAKQGGHHKREAEPMQAVLAPADLVVGA